MGIDDFTVSGLKFSCKRCSSCCRYEAGFVYLTLSDLDRLADYLKIAKDAFIGLYSRWTDKWTGTAYKTVLSLKKKSNKDCIFWDSGCLVYKARPLQCRLFPFWEQIVSSKANWERAAAGCPGMNTGRIYLKEEIDTLLKAGLEENFIFKGEDR